MTWKQQKTMLRSAFVNVRPDFLDVTLLSREAFLPNSKKEAFELVPPEFQSSLVVRPRGALLNLGLNKQLVNEGDEFEVHFQALKSQSIAVLGRPDLEIYLFVREDQPELKLAEVEKYPGLVSVRNTELIEKNSAAQNYRAYRIPKYAEIPLESLKDGANWHSFFVLKFPRPKVDT